VPIHDEPPLASITVVICETDKKDGLGAGWLIQIKPSRQLARASIGKQPDPLQAQRPLLTGPILESAGPDLDLDQLYRGTSLYIYHKYEAPRFRL
jgi:hypothetical protein